MSADPRLDQAARLLSAGHLDGAEALLGAILAANPGEAGALLGLGLVAHGRGRLDEAAGWIARAVQLRPRFADAWYNLGVVEHARGADAAAVAAWTRAVKADPAHAEAHHNLGTVLGARGETKTAKQHYRAAIKADPRHADALNNLAGLLIGDGAMEEALGLLDRALAARAPFPAALVNAATAFQELGRRNEARHLLDTLLAAMPDHAGAHLNRAFLRLGDGDLAGGFAELEWRWTDKPPRTLPMPAWDGGPLAGKSLLLHAEQGFGDTLQFVRYAPMLAATGARVTLAVQPGLVRLLSGMAGVAAVVADTAPPPDCDLHCPLMSLPRLLAGAIPATIPYLAADPALVESWRQRMGSEPGLRVGLVWAGSATHRTDWKRSAPAAALAPLTRLPGIRCYSLQVGRGETLRGAVDLAPHLTDFADTAAALACLDAVVTVDTAVAHLAGALGRDTWVMLPWQAEWRWLSGRDDSPWYPTLRLVRQPKRDDWRSVVAAVAESLSAYAGGCPTTPSRV